jgi:hypothetical protein
MAKIAGQDANDDQLRSSAHYDWNDAAELSGAFKANVTDLAYALARMAEPGGRLSTPDVQNQINRIAPNGMMSKSAIAQALLEIDRGLYRRMSAAKTANQSVGYPVENFQMLRGRLMEGMATLTGPDGVERSYHILYDVDPQDPDKSTVRMKWMVD